MTQEKKKKSKNKKFSLKLSQNELTILLIGVKLLNEMIETVEIELDLEKEEFEVEDLIYKISELLPDEVIKSVEQATENIVDNFDNYPIVQISDLDNNDYSYPMYTVEEKLPLIKKAISENKALEIEYYSMEREDVNKRKIYPYGMKQMMNLYLLVAYCNWRQAIRVFRVDRIKSIKDTNEKFIKPDDFDIDKYLTGEIS